MYHQICELYFKLILHELKQIANMDLLEEGIFIEKVKRVHRYFNHLTSSFDVMTDGMDRTQFLKYRMSLLPASGFQSVQYRSIEFHCTDVVNLTGVNKQNTNNNLTHDFELLYWKNGATELATGKKTLTLRQFEDKYQRKLLRLVERYQHKNIWQKFKQIPNPSPELIEALRALDLAANINWTLAHYRSAAKYLQANSDTIKATGGTNWVQYLPPKFQRVQFFPELWTAAELENWGKNWVEEVIA
jgi:tryptophan 2,3-dioxygenase